MSNKRASNRQPTQNHAVNLLDELDHAILQVLERRGRSRNEEVGEEIGLSASAVSRRIRSLEERGIITGYRALLNDAALGRSMTVFVRVTLERQSASALSAFENGIRRCSHILSCHLMSGEHDYMLLVRVADMADYELLHHNQLSRLPSVSRIESSFAVREIRDNLQEHERRA